MSAALQKSVVKKSFAKKNTAYGARATALISATTPVQKIARRDGLVSPGSPGSRLAPQARERLIVDEAIRYFAEVGFGGQTRELSRRLGITQPLLYRYFPSKQALIDRVYDEVFLARWDDAWEGLIEDRSQSLSERLAEFYRQYTLIIFRPEWIRLYMYSGLAGNGINKRYIARLEKLLFTRICAELRHACGMPDLKQIPVSRDELECIWGLHASIFYYGVRKFIYKLPVHPDPAAVIELAISEMLVAAPLVLAKAVRAQ